RVRPIGLTASPARNRYQYQRSGLSPVDSTCTEWASWGVAMAVPEATTDFIASSSASSQLTSIGSLGSPPSSSSGRGARRVHSTTLVASGSPEATPKVNGSLEKIGLRLAQEARPSSGIELRAPA